MNALLELCFYVVNKKTYAVPTTDRYVYVGAFNSGVPGDLWRDRKHLDNR